MKDFFNLQNNTKLFILALLLALIYAFYYLIKNNKTMELQLKIIVILLIMGFVFGIYNSFKENNNFSLLLNNFSLTEGKINQYFVPNLKGGLPSRGISSSTNSIKYNYYVNKKCFKNGYDFNNYVEIPDEIPDLNITYLVIYEKTDPENSFIFLNYPIKNSDDLEKYKKLFQNKIPKDAFKFNVQE